MARVAVSKLAAYAANPDEYSKHGGQAVNHQAVKYGNQAHDQAGRTTAPFFQTLWPYLLASIAIILVLL